MWSKLFSCADASFKFNDLDTFDIGSFALC